MRRGYSFLQRFVVAVVKPLLLLVTKRRWRGQQHVPATGGVIVAANHLSWTDPLAISHYLYESGRWPVFLAKSELFAIPVLGTLITKVEQVPVYRRSTDAGHALRAAEEAIDRGACVIFYPEGTCTRDPDLWPMLGKTGVARLALSTGAPVIPLAHWGPHELLPYGQKKPRLFPRKTMRMIAGPAVDLSAYREREPTAHNLRDATNEITAAVTSLLAQLRDEQPPALPYDPRPAEMSEGTEKPSQADRQSDRQEDADPAPRGHDESGGAEGQDNR